MNFGIFSLTPGYSALTGEVLLMGLGILAIFLSLTRLRSSPVGVYTVLWGQLLVFAYSLIQALCSFSYFSGPVLGGMVQPNLGHQLASLVLQAIALVIGWMSKRFAQKDRALPLEFFGLLLATTVALMLLIKSSHLAMFFISLEASSLFLALLMALSQPQSPSVALKYLVQSGLSAVIVLWGIVLVYLHTGTLQYASLATLLHTGSSVWALAGVGLILLGLLFKLGVFPFTFYLPEIYEKASTPVLAFLATASKFAAVVALLGLLQQPFAHLGSLYHPLFGALIVVSLLWAALSALTQSNLKRLLAFSGVVHISFILSALFFSPSLSSAVSPVFFYFLGYIPAVLLLLYCAVELNLGAPTLESLRDLYRRHPAFALFIALSLASMAGLPPLVGFIAKFLVLYTIIAAHQYFILLALVFASVVGLYYYLSFIFSLFGRHSDRSQVAPMPVPVQVPFSTRIFVGVMVFILLTLGLVQGSLSFLSR